MEQRPNRRLHWFMGRLENLIPGSDGFAVGGKLSLADVLIYNAFAEFLEDAQASEAVKPFGKAPFTDKVFFFFSFLFFFFFYFFFLFLSLSFLFPKELSPFPSTTNSPLLHRNALTKNWPSTPS